MIVNDPDLKKFYLNIIRGKLSVNKGIFNDPIVARSKDGKTAIVYVEFGMSFVGNFSLQEGKYISGIFNRLVMLKLIDNRWEVSLVNKFNNTLGPATSIDINDDGSLVVVGQPFSNIVTVFNLVDSNLDAVISIPIQERILFGYQLLLTSTIVSTDIGIEGVRVISQLLISAPMENKGVIYTYTEQPDHSFTKDELVYRNDEERELFFGIDIHDLSMALIKNHKNLVK